jgi:hypothetical protein
MGAALLSAACGSKGREFKALYPVHGKVVIDGKAAKGARVVLHPHGEPDPRAILPQAVVGDDGTFTLSTYNFEDGAPAGAYGVTITQFQKNSPVNLFPARYDNPATSGLDIQIEPKVNELEPFTLTR